MLVIVVVVFAICWCLGNQDVGCCCSCVCYLLVFRVGCCSCVFFLFELRLSRCCCCYCCVSYMLVFRLSRCWLLLQLCLLTVGIQVIKMLVVVVVVFANCWYLGYQDVGCCCFSFLFVLRLSRCWLLLLLCLLTVGVQVIKMLVVVVVVFAICWYLGYQDVGCCVCYLLVFRLSRCQLLLLCLLSVGYPGSCIMLLVFSTQL